MVDGTISIIALLPHGLGISKKGEIANEITPSIITSNPKVFLNFFMVIPVKSKDNGTEKKKITEATVCGLPIVSGKIPIAHKAQVHRIRNDAPKRPTFVVNIPLLIKPTVNIIPKIPAKISPMLNIMEATPLAAHIGFSPTIPPKSLNQFSVQLNHGE